MFDKEYSSFAFHLVPVLKMYCFPVCSFFYRLSVVASYFSAENSTQPSARIILNLQLYESFLAPCDFEMKNSIKSAVPLFAVCFLCIYSFCVISFVFSDKVFLKKHIRKLKIPGVYSYIILSHISIYIYICKCNSKANLNGMKKSDSYI